MFASDHALALYNLQQPQAPATIMPASEIMRIKIVRKSNFQTGAIISGTGLEAFYFIIAPIDDTPEDNHLLSALLSGLFGATFGGAVGALSGFDEHIIIDGKVAVYEAFLPKLRKLAAYSNLPPPALGLCCNHPHHQWHRHLQRLYRVVNRIATHYPLSR